MDEVLNNLAVLQRIFEGSADVDFPSGSEWANSSCLVGLRVRSEDSNNLVGCILSQNLVNLLVSMLMKARMIKQSIYTAVDVNVRGNLSKVLFLWFILLSSSNVDESCEQ